VPTKSERGSGESERPRKVTACTDRKSVGEAELIGRSGVPLGSRTQQGQGHSVINRRCRGQGASEIGHWCRACMSHQADAGERKTEERERCVFVLDRTRFESALRTSLDFGGCDVFCDGNCYSPYVQNTEKLGLS
jgi:hypothetical protein